MRHRRRGFDRAQRVGDMLQQTLAQLLLKNMDDERFRLVTLSSVVVSRDLSYAKVYVTIYSDDQEQIKSITFALNRAAKTLRYQLAQQVELRIIPELKFVYDETSAHGFHISSLISDAMKKTDE